MIESKFGEYMSKFFTVQKTELGEEALNPLIYKAITKMAFYLQ